MTGPAHLVIARMWEARTVPGREDDVVAWLRAVVAPAAAAAGAVGVEVYRAPERTVLITRWETDQGWTEPAPPAGAVLRAHAWPFDVVAP